MVGLSLEYCSRQLNDRGTELASLPPTAELVGTLVCHASPRSDMQSFRPDSDDADGALLAEDDPNLIVFGHTHIQFQRPSGRRTLVNPGSVGLPFDGDRRAAYALRPDAGEFDLRRVEYDTHAYAQTVRERMGVALGDAVETLVRRLERAAFVD